MSLKSLVSLAGLLLGLCIYMRSNIVKTPSPNLAVSRLKSLQAEIGRLRTVLSDCRKLGTVSSVESFQPIYVITPTHSRTVQRAELTRLATVLIMVPNIHWILVEDSPVKTQSGKAPGQGGLAVFDLLLSSQWIVTEQWTELYSPPQTNSQQSEDQTSTIPREQT